MAKESEPLRTPSGSPSATARTKHGMDQGKFPVWDAQSAEDAINLRGHGDKASVLAHVSAKAGHLPGVAAKVAAARKEDAG